MACKCQNKTKNEVDIPHIIKPDEPCIFCAEKHLSTAMMLVKEIGYLAVNRQAIIGELVAFQWHIYQLDFKLAEKARNIRHLIQNRKESEITTQFEELASEIDKMMTEFLNKNNKGIKI